MKLLEKKRDYCGKKIQREPVNRYFSTFCSTEHVASYFGAYVDETSDEVYWADFYLLEGTRLWERVV